MTATMIFDIITGIFTIIGVFYTFAGWALVMAWGPSQVLGAAAADPTNMVVLTAQNYLGTAGAMLLQVLLLTSLFACVLSFHNVLARYFFSLGNTGVLPVACGRSHPRHASPHVASLVTSVVGAVLMVVCAIAGLDPVLEIFTWLAGIASVGIVLLMALACLAAWGWSTAAGRVAAVALEHRSHEAAPAHRLRPGGGRRGLPPERRDRRRHRGRSARRWKRSRGRMRNWRRSG